MTGLVSKRVSFSAKILMKRSIHVNIKDLYFVLSDETLVVVTADHSHVFTVGGYQTRGNPIFGFTNKNSPALDGQNFTTLGYYNGPGAKINESRKAPTAEQLKDPEFEWTSSLVPLKEDTHGGEDVGM